MEKGINILLVLLLLVSCIFNVVLVNRLDKSIDEILETKLTNIETNDTIFLDSVIFDTVYVEKEIVKLPIYNTDTIKQTDSVVAVDSIFVEFPIEVKHFSDTLAMTAISFDMQGYNCKIKDLHVRNFLSVPTQEKAVNKWYDNINIGVGFGITYIDKFRFVPTFGIYYKIF